MTQTTSQIGADQSGLAYRNADNAGKQAILNHHKGSSAPSYAEAGIIWLNDSGTPWLLKVYDGADWITLGEINATTNTFQPYNGAAGERVLNYAADTGAANAYAIAPSPAITAYVAGQLLTFKPGNANTGASTVNVNTQGTKNIKLLDGTNPIANNLLTAGVYMLVYDGTNFVLLNPSLQAFTGDSGSGGAKGLVPAPSAGDAAANKVLGAGGGWVNSSSSITLNSQSADYTLLAADKSCIVELTGSTAHTFAFTAAATLGSGWFCFLHNNSTAELTLDPNSSEQIDALTSYKMYPGEVRLVQCSGSAFSTIILNGGTATFNSSGTWTRPPGYNQFEFNIWSGGSAGASRATTGNAPGGGGGAHVKFNALTSNLAATETVTVAATAAGVSGSTSGTAGNNSSITINSVAFMVAGAGSPITQSAADAAGGSSGSFSDFYPPISGVAAAQGVDGVYAASGGGVANTGHAGYVGGNSIDGGGGGGGAGSTTASKAGGSSIYGGAGGASGTTAGSNGTDGTAPGGGGGGAVNGGTSGSGAAGRVTVRGLL